MSNITWENVTFPAGIEPGLSWGAAWGDFNGDKYPDLWINYHIDSDALYINQGDGTFINEIETIVDRGDIVGFDVHGVAWADFDNDGDQDLVQQNGSGRGAARENDTVTQLYVNENGQLINRVVELSEGESFGTENPIEEDPGVGYARARGRSPLWLDYDNDGKLDLLLGQVPRNDGIVAPPKIFRQNENGKFEDVSSVVGFEVDQGKFSFLSDFSGDGNLDLIFRDRDRFRVFDITSTPFEDITSEVFPDFRVTGGIDTISGDFNNDLLTDFYLTKPIVDKSDTYQNDSNKFTSVISLDDETLEKGLRFNTTGDVDFDLTATDGRFSIDSDSIFIGENALSINEFEVTSEDDNYDNDRNFKFTLTPDDPQVQGIVPQSDRERGVYISYDPSTELWTLDFSIPEGSLEQFPTASISAIIESTEEIDNLQSIGFEPDPAAKNDQLLINSDQGFIDQTESAGINTIPVRGRSVVTGDFDNDMDLDLYIVTSRSVFNTPNIFYENQGDGTFIPYEEGTGAEGTELGYGDIVIAADYDLDGFLDLSIGNGQGAPSPLIENPNPPYELFRNQGNDNHWLQIDLQGRTSNRDGIGAQIFVTAGGVTQLRETTGGMHSMVQDNKRIHFGLADNTEVEKLVVRWPSGVKQTIKGISVDRLIQIVEPGSNEDDLVIGDSSDDVISTREGNDLLVGRDGDDFLEGNDGDDILRGGRGKDILIGGNDNDFLRGKEGRDVLRGGANNDTLEGNEGNDTLRGGSNRDILIGGLGNDDLQGEIGQDILRGGAGSDTLEGQEGNDTLFGGVGRDTLIGTEGDDNLIGGNGNDSLRGGEDNDVIDGGEGNDILKGNAGNDSLKGDRGSDTLEGGAGNDTLLGKQGRALLIGRNDNDFLEGNAGNDTLRGQEGNDTLRGGKGNDTLTGGDDRDSFIFDMPTTFDSSDLGVDLITDFSVGIDLIHLSKDTFNTLDNNFDGQLRNSDFEIVTTDTSARVSNAEIVYNSSNGNLYYNPNNTDAGFGNGGLFAVLNGSLDGLSTNDFQVVATE